MDFDFQGARDEGYSDDEILSYLSENSPDFDVMGAVKEGYSPEDIYEYLSSAGETKNKEEPESSFLSKAGRTAAQLGLGALESKLWPYELAVAPLAIPGGQETLGDLFTSEILSDVYPTEEEGRAPRQTIFSKPERELAEPINLGTRALIEKATGLDLHPEGVIEKAANWIGFIKDPKKIFELGKTGLTKMGLIKAIAPTGTELLRGAGAGVALEMAEQGEFGPVGTMAAAVMGDISGNLAASAGKTVKNIVTNPRQALAEVASKFTKKDKLELQKDIIQDFRDANIQADIGTITNSELVKWTQARLAQSGLTGDGLDSLKKTITTQVREEYKALADELGAAKYANTHAAGEVLKESVTKLRDADLQKARSLFTEAEKELTESSYANPKKLAKKIRQLEKKLEPGNLKSAEQSAVLDVMQRLKRDIYDSEGSLIYPRVKSLINDKLALQDLVDYEVQGGAKKLLKDLIRETDRAILSHGADNPAFARKYTQAKQHFGEHAKTFRNKNIDQLLKSQKPEQLMNRFDTVQGIRDLRNILSKTPEGQDIFNSLSRLHLDQVIGNNMVDSTTEQLKFGTFSKLLEKGKNKDIIQEILPPKAFKRLTRIQKNSGILAETGQKFLNASKSGVTLADAGVAAKFMTDVGWLLSGNPWPILKTGTGIAGVKYITHLISDPEFLKLVEESILSAQQNNTSRIASLAKEMAEPIKAAIAQTKNTKKE